MSKTHRPNITAGFELSQIEFLRKLGQGMTGTVCHIFIYYKTILINLNFRYI